MSLTLWEEKSKSTKQKENIPCNKKTEKKTEKKYSANATHNKFIGGNTRWHLFEYFKNLNDIITEILLFSIIIFYINKYFCVQ